MNYPDLFSALAPESIIVLTALVVLAVDLLGLRGAPMDRRQSVAAWLSVAGIAVAITMLSGAPSSPRWLAGYIENSPTSAFVKQVTLALAGLTDTSVRAEQASASTPPVSATLWLWRGSCKISNTEPAAPVLRSRAP